jgi:hypothetical protein
MLYVVQQRYEMLYSEFDKLFTTKKDAIGNFTNIQDPDDITCPYYRTDN